MSTDIAQIKADIKAWQRAYRKTHGRDPGKDELRKNPDIQAKYAIWQASLKPANNASTPPKRTPIIPKNMPVQSTAAPTTPFSARKRAVTPEASCSKPKLPNPFSAAKSRAITLGSQPRSFPVLDSDSDDNPFAPASPTRSRRSSISPTKSRTRLDAFNPLHSSIMTPRTKARKRMRGEDVPTTPGDKRRKLVPAVTTTTAIPPPIFGTKRASSSSDDEEIVDSPRKKSAVGRNGRVFASVFDDSEVSSPHDGKSTPPPPSSSAPDEMEDMPPVTKPSTSAARYTNDTWDAPAPGADFTHLRGKQKKTKKPVETKRDEPDRVANPFELLPPDPGDEPVSAKSNGRAKSKGKGVVLKPEAMDGESSDVEEGIEEIEWRPHGPLRSTAKSASGQLAVDETAASPSTDYTLPSDLRTLLSIQPSQRQDVKAEALARDVLAGRVRTGATAEVWGVGDLGEWEQDEAEEGDWESEPEGWKGDVEM